jgi:putative membrane protein
MAFGVLAFIHLLGVVLAPSSVLLRGRALRRYSSGGRPEDLATALTCDNVWGVSALVLLPTGLYRLFALGKGTDFYLQNGFFHAKMVLFGIVFLLELWPMAVLVKHRIASSRAAAGDLVTVEADTAGRIATISAAQAVMLPLIIGCAAFMARGLGQLAG